MKIEVYTDGSVLVNPNGPGGWAFVVVRDGDAREQVSGHSPSTTNNIMEMTAALEAMRFIPEPEQFTIVSDSEYVVKGLAEWVPRWKRNGWRKYAPPAAWKQQSRVAPTQQEELQLLRGPGAPKPSNIKNLELWKTLDAAFDPKRMTIAWVKGHSGQAFNEIADYLAGREAHCYA